MPYFRRRFRYRVRRPWRVRRLYRRRGYARKYVNASSRSMVRVKVNQTYTTTTAAGYGNAATGATINYVSPYDLSSGSVVGNPLYQAYCGLYEETKMIGMKVVLSVTSAVGGSDTPSLEIYTAWDRRHGYGEAAMTVPGIRGSSSNTIATALNNNVAKVTRSIYASDLIEKAQWHDSEFSGGRDSAWVSAGANPNFFCPSLFFFFNSPSLGAAHNIGYSVSVTYYVAFRNPRYGGSSSSKDLPTKSVTFSDVDGFDGDLGDEMVDPAAVALPPDVPGDFPEDSSLTPGAVVARANTSARRAQSAYEKRTGRVVVIDPTRGGKKNA